MPDAPRSQERSRPPQARDKARTVGHEAPESTHEAARPQTPAFSLDSGISTAVEKSASMKMTEAKATAGQAGESNIAIQWIDVWIGNCKSCRFEVKTQPDNALEFLVEQRAYRKTYTGTGAISTQPLPVEAPGTTCKVTAHDVSTGETLEQAGYWYGREGLFHRLWNAIRSLFWK